MDKNKNKDKEKRKHDDSEKETYLEIDPSQEGGKKMV